MIALELEEEERQLVLLALAVLSLESPGFDHALNEIAKKIDNVEKVRREYGTQEDRAQTFDQFREARRFHPHRVCNHPIHKLGGDNGFDDT